MAAPSPAALLPARGAGSPAPKPGLGVPSWQRGLDGGRKEGSRGQSRMVMATSRPPLPGHLESSPAAQCHSLQALLEQLFLRPRPWVNRARGAMAGGKPAPPAPPHHCPNRSPASKGLREVFELARMFLLPANLTPTIETGRHSFAPAQLLAAAIKRVPVSFQ